MKALAEFLSSNVRAEVCRLLYGSVDEELHLRDLARRSGCSFSSVQREIEKLSRQGIVARREDGNRTYFSANKTHPFYADIRSLVRKSNGLAQALGEALADKRIQAAFIFGSMAAGTEKPGSDVDVMIVGSVSLLAVVGKLRGLQERLGREINPHVFTAAEYARRVKAKDHFLTTVMREPKQFVIGGDVELAGLA